MPFAMKSLLKNTSTVWLTLCAMGGVLGMNTAFAQVGIERIKQRGVVTVGYREDAAPFSSKDASGKPVGYSLDLCNPIAASLAKQAGLAPTAVRHLAVATDQQERYVKGAQVDLMCAATSDTPERRANMGFSPPIFVSSVKLLVRKDSKIGSIDQLVGAKPVAVIDRTTAAKAVETYAKQNNLALSVDRSVAPDAALGQLKLGWASAYARDEVLLTMQLVTSPNTRDYVILPQPISAEDIAIALPPSDPGLNKAVLLALIEARDSGAWAAAYERWFMKPIAPANVALNIPMSDALKASIAKLKP